MVVLVNADPPPATRREEDGMGPYTQAYMQVAIANAAAGDRILAAYTMEYARRLEYGFVGVDSLGRSYNQAPVGWVRRAAAQWKAVVAESVAEAKARSPSKGQL